MKLRQNQIKTELVTIPGWRLRGRQISRLFVLEDFVQAVRFVNRVAKLAEGMNHHPDIDIRYDKVKLNLTTHDEGGLTMKDFKLARKIDQSYHH